MVEIGAVTFDTVLSTGSNFLFTAPNGTIVLSHARWFVFKNADCLEVAKTVGSANNIAVASTVLGIKNVPGREDERTASTVAPGIPEERRLISAPTTGFYTEIYGI